MSNKYRNGLLHGVATIGLAIFSSPAANAQDAPKGQTATPTPAEVAATSPTSGDIVVTARKRRENLQDVPLTVTAITSQELTAATAQNLQDISFLTPGLVYNSSGAQANASLVIRGISDTSGGESSTQNVSVFLDGVYIANPSAIDLQVGGLERVEIVEGPVSGIYGRNAFTGAVNYVTQKPTDVFHFNVAETFGTDGKEQVDAGISGAIIPGILKARLAGTFDKFNGTYHDNVSGQNANGHNRKDFLANIMFTPTKNLVVNPGHDFFSPAATVTYAQNCALTTGNSYCGNLGENQIGPYIQKPDQSGANGLTRHVTHVHVDSRLTGSWGSLDALVGYNNIRTKSFGNYDGQEYGLLENLYNAAGMNIGTVYSPNKFGNQATEKDASVEVRYDSPSDRPLRFSVGGFYLNHHTTSQSIFSADLTNVPAGDHTISPGFDFTSGGQPVALTLTEQHTYDASGFVGLDYDIMPNLTVSTALRETSERQTQSQPAPYQGATFHSFTTNESITWKVTPHLTTYISGGNGSKAGGFNGASVSSGSDTYAPETDWDVEGGVKGSMLDGMLLFTGDIYHLNISNLQVIGPQPNSVALVVSNIGALKNNGVEMSATLTPGGGFSLSGGVAYSQPRFKGGSLDYNSGAFSTNDVGACALIASCASSRLIAATATTPAAVNLKGLRPPFESDLVFNTSAEYRQPLGFVHDVEWFVRADYRYESKQYNEVTNFAYYGPRNIFNVHLGLTGKRWTATAYVLNVLNDKTPVTEQANAVLDSDNSPLFPNRPSNVNGGGVSWIPTSVLPDGRTFAVRLAYNF